MKTLSALGSLLAILVLCAPTASAQNLLTNPGFEDGGGSYDGWFTFGSGPNISTAATDNIFNTGAAASKLFGEFNLCPFPGQFDVGGFGQAINVTAGKTYEFSGVRFISDADPLTGEIVCDNNRAIAKVAFFDAASGGNELASNEIVIGSGSTPTEQWIPFSLTSQPAPAGAVRMEALIIFLQPGCDTGSVFTDDLSVVEMDTPSLGTNLVTNPSFDSGVDVAWTKFGNIFDETRGAFVYTPGNSIAMFSTFVEASDSGISQVIAVTGGTDYTFGAQLLSTCVEDAITGGNNNFVLGKIDFRDAGGQVVGAPEAIFLDNTNSLGEWTFASLNTTAPATAVSAEVFLLFVSPILEGGKVFVDDVFFGEASATDAPSAARGFVLDQNSPNPFNPKTNIRFALERAGDVQLRVYDTKGRLVRTLADGRYDSGSWEIQWDGRSDSGSSVASGIYHYVLETQGGRESRSMVLLK